jgi:alginate O-acetyltransferase complex protein AlgJ
MKQTFLFVTWLILASAFLGNQVVASDVAEEFRLECAAKAEAAEKSGTMTVLGKEGWMFFAPELRHVGAGPFWGEAAVKVSRATKPELADPLPAILDFKAQLDKAGIELLLVPVPPKALIYPEAISEKVSPGSPPARLDAPHQAFYDLLRRSGVKVIDWVPDFLKARGTEQLYCKQDTHWSGQTCVLAAQWLAKELRSRSWYDGVTKQKFADETKTIELTGDLWRELGSKAPAKETLPLRFVGIQSGASLKPIEDDRASPVVLLGDSHSLIFHAGDDMQARGAGLPDQLALELGFPVDVIAVRGSGATPARVNLLRWARQPGYLGKKKAVIWCFGAREFTESSGWQKVPVVK